MIKSEIDLKITCIGHSGFLVEYREYNLIFDYYTDKKNIITPELFSDKRTCVFVSHNHYDHYNPKVFEWIKWGEVIYVLDSGCTASGTATVHKIRESESLDVFDGDISIRAYGSTDEGVSFLVKLSELSKENTLTVFHAGDLNDWYWEEESTIQELIEAEESYLKIISELAGEKIDAAFIPEDPRLGKNASRGVKLFKKVVSPEKVIPMHFPNNEGKKY